MMTMDEQADLDRWNEEHGEGPEAEGLAKLAEQEEQVQMTIPVTIPVCIRKQCKNWMPCFFNDKDISYCSRKDCARHYKDLAALKE